MQLRRAVPFSRKISLAFEAQMGDIHLPSHGFQRDDAARRYASCVGSGNERCDEEILNFIGLFNSVSDDIRPEGSRRCL